MATKAKTAAAAKPAPRILYRSYSWNGDRWTITLDDLTKAIALYAGNQSAFARDVVKTDPRRVRAWLAGAGMNEAAASKVRDFLAKPVEPSRQVRENARRSPWR